MLNVVRCRVAVIGAGIAGLSAAKVLRDNDIGPVEIVEAQDYVGGRIQTVKQGDDFVELGAQWLHAGDYELTEICDEHDLLSPVTSQPGDVIFIREDGYVFDQEMAEDVNEVVDTILDKIKNTRDHSDKMSVGNFVDYYFNKLIEDLDDETRVLWKQLYDWNLKLHYISNSCMSLKDLSAARFGDYDFVGDETRYNSNFENGYSSIIDVLVHQIPNVNINLKMAVNKILWNDRDEVVKLYCDGTLFIADYIICTIPLGALKEQHKELFDPPLPHPIVTAIEKLGFGIVNIIILEFEKAWWMDAKALQIVRAVDEKDEDWYHYIMGFEVLKNLKNSMIAWVGGYGAQYMEILPINRVAKDCIYLLEKCTKSQMPQLTGIKRSKWYSNPNVRGAWSYVSVECNAAKVTPSSLHRPVRRNGEPVILFAGEACHNTLLSTTHGAYESGKIQAQYLVNYLNN